MFYHLKERQISGWDTVKVDNRVGPWIVEFETCLSVLNERGADDILFTVLTTVEASAEQRHAHDAKDKPEDKTDEQDIEDGRYRLDKRVHYHLPHTAISQSHRLA